jgi:tetratricopeptide (TPR) repeat protein
MDSLFAVAYADLGFGFYLKMTNHGAPMEWADSVLLMARRAVDLDPDLPRGHTVLGIAHSLQGRTEAAKDAYLQAVRLNPSYASPLNNLGFDALNAGRCDEAYEWLKRAHGVDPRDAYPMASLADAAMCLDMDDEAVRWLEKSADLETPFHALPAYWVTLELKRGRVEEARNRAIAWFQEQPDDLFAREVNAATAMFNGEVDVAAREFEALYRDVPDWAFAWMTADIRTGLAWALLEKGEEDRAQELLEETRQWLADTQGRTDDEIGILYGFALIEALSGNTEEALTWLEEGIERGGGRGYRETAIDPRFKLVSDDPGFTALMENMKIDVDSMRARLERGEVELGIR